MEDILRPIYQERASQANTLGVLMIKKRQKDIPVTDTFDAVLLVLVAEADSAVSIKHYTYHDKKAALYIVTEQQLNEWLLLGSNKKIFDWLYNGKILFDRNEYIQNIKTELMEFPFYGRKLKMGLEFAKLIRRYMDGKAFFENDQYLDAYNHIVHSLHHLARLAVIEQGFHPEVTVWQQVKQIDPEITKLYEELVTSHEPLDKRLELLFLASEFLIHSKMKSGIQHLVDVLAEKEFWSINEIISHEEVHLYSVDLTMLLEYLIDKGIIEVVMKETKGQGVFHRYYMLGKKLS
ncbi:nucleotidyltransferase-like protein [Cytobacillus massiliigabonensis]|uniref:nucleotidyltransferase-like protein n=1 Tax=Cytobacillus massiliigabonensis TaxID=1871011 RepID=UPI000C84E259|nr:nucleotidyltransferase-like protein [Cytobacillus massiliigabonensis]